MTAYCDTVVRGFSHHEAEAVSNNFYERIDQKIFHAEIVVDRSKVSAEMKAYQLIHTMADFTNEDGSDNLKEAIEANYKRVKKRY